MAKKYYATQLNPEYFDYECYFDEEEADYIKFWAGGNRDFCDVNKDLRADVVKALENCRYDLETIDEDDLTDDEKNAERLNNCKYYFSSLASVELSDEDYFKLGACANEWYAIRSRDENDLICKVLSILHGKEFVNGTIRGCCQSDWMDYICPKEVRDNNLEYIEAVLFGTGTEFAITESAVEPEDVEDADTFCDYTHLWRTDDIKEWLAKKVIGCEVEEVVVRKISATHHITTFDYSEE